jgi:hypothetical protein
MRDPTLEAMLETLADRWDAALDADERALSAAEKARTLEPADLVPLRKHLQSDRRWLAHWRGEPA